MGGTQVVVIVSFPVLNAVPCLLSDTLSGSRCLSQYLGRGKSQQSTHEINGFLAVNVVVNGALLAISWQSKVRSF